MTFLRVEIVSTELSVEPIVPVLRDLGSYLARVGDTGRLEQDQLDVPLGYDAMLGAVWNDAELTGPERHRRFFSRLFLEYVQLALQNPKQLVLVVVGMPRNLVSFQSYDLDVLSIELPDDLGRKSVGEFLEAAVDSNDF
jgi:hypothetical protein